MENIISLNKQNLISELKEITEKVIAGERITENDALLLYTKADLPLVGMLANFIREKKHGNNTYYNHNFHIEPTNICIYNCKFCSYSRKAGNKDAWEFSLEEIAEKARSYKDKKVTEVHIVGGVHPDYDLHYYGKIIEAVKKELPHIHVKAFSAVEIDFIIKRAKLSYAEGLRILKNYGLDSIPGGGAEIFDEELRRLICPEKTTSEKWLEIHKAAHNEGIATNATMLYGHIENYEHRIDHMNRLRKLQDETHGFLTFIPLKYRKENNPMANIGEVSVIEDLKNFAVSRIFLDNFDHIKAYWVAIGKHIAQTALAFGVDDIDGTIDDSTKIYTMAGAEEQKPTMSTSELKELIWAANRIPVERDTLYNVVES